MFVVVSQNPFRNYINNPTETSLDLQQLDRFSAPL